MELQEIDVADSLVPHFQVNVNFQAFHEHSWLHLVQIKDEHSTLSSTMSNKSTVFLNKAPILIEPYLPALFYHLAYRD